MRKFLLCFVPAMLLVFSACDDEPAPVPPNPVPSSSVVPSPKPSVSPKPSPSPSASPKPVSGLIDASAAVHAQVDKYLERFVEDGRIEGLDIVKLMSSGSKLKVRIASLDSLGSGVIGLCQTGGGSRTVTLDPDFFRPSQNDLQNQLLVHHEFGHCVLNRPHRTSVGMIPDGSGHSHEMSIMYPLIMGSLQYSSHQPWYNAELYQELSIDDEPKVYICE